MPKRAVPENDVTPRSKPKKARKNATKPARDYPQVEKPEITKYRLPLKDGDVIYIADFLGKATADKAFQAMQELDTYYQPQLKVYGKTITQSRQIAAYATKDFELVYSGAKIPMHTEYPPALTKVQEMVEERLGMTFNHCMINKYDDGSVYIGKHRDNPENKVIASISLGAERDFILTHDQYTKNDETEKDLLLKHRFPLSHGSLVIMQGETQDHWKHEIPKQAKVKKGRISLTFRQMEFS